MKISGTHSLPFAREAVWAALTDPDVLSRTLPGCERLEAVGEGVFAGTLKVQIGPVRGEFEGTVELTELAPPDSYHMKLAGEGASGFMNGEGDIHLEEEDAGTRIRYDLEAQVGGRIAGVGQRLLDSSARVITRQGLEGLERQLAARHPSGGEEATATGGAEAALREPPPAPTRTRFATAFARGLWEEMIPASARPWVIAGVAAVAALAVLLIVRACTG